MSDVFVDEHAHITHLRDISGTQWKSGIAAWLGWFFDGLDLHLFTIVATPFVAQLLAMDEHSDAVRDKSAWIQAAFLIGWALGGGMFGRVGDRLGRSRALMLTILMYAMFTGLSYFAHTWWQLLIYRFLAALGIGGEWAVGASILSETWPAKWRHWVAAVLQTGVNFGILLAMLAGYVLLPLLHLPDRTVFLVGVLPALLVLWIRRAVPEPDEWQAARESASHRHPPFTDLFRGRVLRITVPAVLVCATSLTGHWAFMFWFAQHMRNLADVAGWSAADQSRLPIIGLTITVGVSTIGNFVAGALAGRIGYQAGGRGVLSGVFCVDVLCVPRAANDREHVGVAAADRIVPGRVRAVHDVLAAAVSDAAAHDRRRVLLQHRPAGGGVRHRVLGNVRRCGQLPAGSVLHELLVFTGGGVCAAAARVAAGERDGGAAGVTTIVVKTEMRVLLRHEYN